MLLVHGYLNVTGINQIIFKDIFLNGRPYGSMDYPLPDHISAWFHHASTAFLFSLLFDGPSLHGFVVPPLHLLSCSQFFHTCNSRSSKREWQWWWCQPALTWWWSEPGNWPNRPPIVHQSKDKHCWGAGCSSQGTQCIVQLVCTINKWRSAGILHNWCWISRHKWPRLELESMTALLCSRSHRGEWRQRRRLKLWTSWDEWKLLTAWT